MEITGFPNYLIYPDGRVWSKFGEGKFLRPQGNGGGYYFVTLYKNQKPKTHLIHRLIGIYYIDNPHNFPIIDHKNRITTDNRIENLRWTTHMCNMQNLSKAKDNTSGHKSVSYNKRRKEWRFQKNINRKMYIRTFKSKIDCICYKYIMILKFKVLSKNT